jgi:hypothetical protein
MNCEFTPSKKLKKTKETNLGMKSVSHSSDQGKRSPLSVGMVFPCPQRGGLGSSTPVPNKYTDSVVDEIKEQQFEKDRTQVRHYAREHVFPQLTHGYRVYCRKSKARESWFYTMKYGIFGYHY